MSLANFQLMNGQICSQANNNRALKDYKQGNNNRWVPDITIAIVIRVVSANHSIDR